MARTEVERETERVLRAASDALRRSREARLAGVQAELEAAFRAARE